jgi:DNA-binding MarR family transcriptional regulator
VPPTPPPSRAQLAELADVVLELAHQLDLRTPALRDVVPLTGTEIAVIRQIHRAPRSTPSQIAEVTGLRRSNVSTAIRTLETGGLVVRDQLVGNARSVALVPTALASETVSRINAYWADLLQDVPEDLLTEGLAAAPWLARIAEALARRTEGDAGPA